MPLGTESFNPDEPLMDWTMQGSFPETYGAVAESTGQQPHDQIDGLIAQSSILNLLSSLMEPAPGINPWERIKEEETIMRKIGHIPELLMGFGLLTSPQGARKAVTKVGAKGLLKETSKFKKWFKGSKILDDQGSPKVVYHGTEASFDEFNRALSLEGGVLPLHQKRFGFHFGSAEVANERLRDRAVVGSSFSLQKASEPEFLKGSNIIPAYLNIKKPLRLPDISEWENSYLVARQLEKHYPKKFKGISDKLAGIEEKGYRLDWDEYKLNAEQVDYLRDAIKAEGYDGIVYSNQYEGILQKDRPIFGRPKGDLSITGNDSYIAFEPDQIKMKRTPK